MPPKRSKQGAAPTAIETPAADPRWSVAVRDLPIELIDEDEDNAREHHDDNLDGIRASLEEYGLQKPIVVVPKAGGRFKTIAGNGTLRVARRMGATTISASISGLEGLRQIGYAIADNRTGETSTWDYRRLRGHLENLQAGGFNMPATAWAPPEIRNLLNVRPPLPAPAAVEEQDKEDENRGEQSSHASAPAQSPAPEAVTGAMIKSEVFVLNPEEVELLDRIAAREGIDGKHRLRDALMYAVRACAGQVD